MVKITNKGGAGGAAVPTYTNLTPTEAAHGGVSIGDTFNAQTMTQMFDLILYPYVAIEVSLGSDLPAGVYEFGDTTDATTLTPNVTEHGNPLVSLTFQRQDNGGGYGNIQVQANDNPYSNNPDTNVGNAPAVAQVASTNFRARADDGTSTVTSNVLTYNYVYPFYYGVGAPGLNGAQIAALTKLVQTQGDKVLHFAPANEVYYFAYPAAYPDLNRVLDQNLFDITADFVLTNPVVIVGLDASNQNYKVYEFQNLTNLEQDLTFDF